MNIEPVCHRIPAVPDLLMRVVAKSIEAPSGIAPDLSRVRRRRKTREHYFRAFGKGSQQGVLRAFAPGQER
jgi:hypothetical protein